MFVDIKCSKSKNLKIYTGVPQGTVLGPLLFLLYINDAPVIKDVKNIIFADDKGLFTHSFRIDTIINRLQKAVVRNKKFFEKWKIKINSDKTEAIIFSKRRPDLTNNISIQGNIILWSDYVKYLGIILDSKLTFTKHINLKNQKAIALLISLYPLLNRKSNLSPQNKKLLYITLIRPVLTYACEVWNFTSQTNFNKLQVTQNKFLRLIGKFRMFTPINEIHEALNVDMIKKYVKNRTENYFDKIIHHKNKLLNQIPYENKECKHKQIMHIIYNM